MNKLLKWILIVVGVIFVSLLFLISGALTIFNVPLNKLFAGTPDKSCVNDSDCAYKSVDCKFSCCNSGAEAVNKDWNNYCVFPSPQGKFSGSRCSMVRCMGPPELSCIDNICKANYPDVTTTK